MADGQPALARLALERRVTSRCKARILPLRKATRILAGEDDESADGSSSIDAARSTSTKASDCSDARGADALAVLVDAARGRR